MFKAASTKEIGKRLEHARRARKVTIAKLADACEFSRASWDNWRNGKQQPGSAQLTRIALYLGMTPNQILLSDPSHGDDATETNLQSLSEINRLVLALDRSAVRPSAVIEQVCRTLHDTYPPRANTAT